MWITYSILVITQADRWKILVYTQLLICSVHKLEDVRYLAQTPTRLKTSIHFLVTHIASSSYHTLEQILNRRSESDFYWEKTHFRFLPLMSIILAGMSDGDVASNLHGG